MVRRASSSDVADLREFMRHTRDVLRKLVDAREVLFRESVRQLIEDSWKLIDQAIESVITELQTAGSGLTPKLKAAGLTGPQLKLKLAGFNRAFERFSERGTVMLAKKVLKWINKILGSLMSAIPGAEPIKEFKEALEEELDESDPV